MLQKRGMQKLLKSFWHQKITNANAPTDGKRTYYDDNKAIDWGFEGVNPALRIHDLRRTLGSWQAATGANSYIIGKSLGHKTQQATAIYS